MTGPAAARALSWVGPAAKRTLSWLGPAMKRALSWTGPAMKRHDALSLRGAYYLGFGRSGVKCGLGWTGVKCRLGWTGVKCRLGWTGVKCRLGWTGVKCRLRGCCEIVGPLIHKAHSKRRAAYPKCEVDVLYKSPLRGVVRHEII